ncbi:TRAP transporter small permease [Enemella sp. A6]|uniref:TRAP transporter small permease n=1 Tax=Enemella sp. A6 TaxID=3440152 RepID=UPI003EBC33F5
MKAVDRVLKTIATFSVWIAALCIVIMALLVTVAVASRFFLGEPLTALFEFSEYSILAITMLAAPLLLREDEHVKVDLLSELLGNDHWISRAADWLVAVIILVICVTLAWFSVTTALNDHRVGAVTSTYLQLPRWPLTALLAVGSLGLLVESVRRILALPGRRETDHATDSVSPTY